MLQCVKGFAGHWRENGRKTWENSLSGGRIEKSLKDEKLLIFCR
jgi:hypothetical protein